jgi:hypothetical protein
MASLIRYPLPYYAPTPMQSAARFERRYELLGHVCRELKRLALTARNGARLRNRRGALRERRRQRRLWQWLLDHLEVEVELERVRLQRRWWLRRGTHARAAAKLAR